MRYKTAELTGALLDAAVAKALGWRCYHWSAEDWGWRLPPTEDDEIGMLCAESEWSPSTCWEIGGPLIESNRIDCTPKDGPGMFMGEPMSGPRWLANLPGKWCETGPTLLIAAMRAFVAHKLGNEVDLTESHP